MLIDTSTLKPTDERSASDQLQIYNALDCCLTFEIHDSLKRLTNAEPIAYSFARAMQAPALEMMLRGFKVDGLARRQGQEELREKLKRLDSILQQYAFAVWGKTLNPRSSKQLKEFFYGAMGLPEVWVSQKGVRKLSLNREALEKLEVYFHAMPIIACILAVRDYSKQLETLVTEVDADGRMRTSYNIAGTETGRWSSSSNAFGTGGNLQNIAPKLRNVFIADPGWKLCGIDLEQAESREVGWLCGTLFNDWSYLDACYSGDLHTLTAKLIWPNLGWSGDAKRDRALADLPFYREFSRRDMSKRGGHGSNYYGTPFTMARHLKVPVSLMRSFQERYFEAFPCIRQWHTWVAGELQTTQRLVTPFGRERHFFGRPNDDSTLREAIAFSPQSSTGDRMNLGLWRVWKHMPEVRLLAQVHDAIYFLYRPEQEAQVIAKALQLIDVKLTDARSGRTLVVPGEAKVGWNWASASERNPDGLIKYNPAKPDTRTRTSLLNQTL